MLTYHYAPSNAIGAARTTALATYLASGGDDVRVVASDSTDSTARLVPELGVVQVFRVFGPPRPLARSAARVRTRKQPATPSVATKQRRHAFRPLLCQIAARIATSAVDFPDRSLPWSREAFKVGLDVTRHWHPDVVLVSGPPFSSFIAASRLARHLRVPWIADYRDLWSNSTYYPYLAPRRPFDALLERLVVRQAAALVTVSEPLADDLGRLHGRRAEVVLNGHAFHNSDVTLAGEPLGGQLNLVYTGQIYPGRRDPRPLFEAIALLGPAGNGVRVHFAGPHGEAAREAAASIGVPNCVVDHGLLDRTEALRLQIRADVLLLLMWNDPGETGVFTGKLFEYLFARRPILMLGWPHGVAAQLIGSRGAGVVLNDPTEIADQLRVWLAEIGTSVGIQPLPVSVTCGLTRDEQNERYVEIIRNTVGGGRPGEAY